MLIKLAHQYDYTFISGSQDESGWREEGRRAQFGKRQELTRGKWKDQPVERKVPRQRCIFMR
ncbi:hypothetical protein [Mechercharimyces sp. CAU 1602]|uniref:hypothetical protein n=1 Tax=Mechercharimyces sp. CAU 1602 TaxID=2973933 RepID=UPI002161B219|nr:hypothetical protein [Mechercharimyces sp. CAU 1602]MCS1350816.1 hypothetical protein [Mechercharimyces sp. CAU 1602]